jgi:hypothetical protein
MAKNQRLGKNSTTALIKSIGEITNMIELPDGVVLRSDEEMTIWEQFTRTRVRQDWRDFDLVLLAKTVRLEADIRKYQSDLDKIGAVILNERGTLCVNPLVTVVDSLQRQQLSIMRSMSMQSSGVDPRTKASAAKTQLELKSKINSADDLIGRPA